MVNQTGTLLKKADTWCTANYISHCPIPPGMRPLARVHQDPDYSPEPWLFRLEGRRRRGMMEGMKEGRKDRALCAREQSYSHTSHTSQQVKIIYHCTVYSV